MVNMFFSISLKKTLRTGYTNFQGCLLFLTLSLTLMTFPSLSYASQIPTLISSTCLGFYKTKQKPKLPLLASFAFCFMQKVNDSKTPTSLKQGISYMTTVLKKRKQK